MARFLQALLGSSTELPPSAWSPRACLLFLLSWVSVWFPPLEICYQVTVSHFAEDAVRWVSRHHLGLSHDKKQTRLLFCLVIEFLVSQDPLIFLQTLLQSASGYANWTKIHLLLSCH